jgi:hypothetical protein
MSQNIQHMGVHYWLVEQTKAEINTTDTLAANTKNVKNFFLQVLQNSQNHILVLFLFE